MSIPELYKNVLNRYKYSWVFTHAQVKNISKANFIILLQNCGADSTLKFNNTGSVNVAAKEKRNIQKQHLSLFLINFIVAKIDFQRQETYI